MPRPRRCRQTASQVQQLIADGIDRAVISSDIQSACLVQPIDPSYKSHYHSFSPAAATEPVHSSFQIFQQLEEVKRVRQPYFLTGVSSPTKIIIDPEAYPLNRTATDTAPSTTTSHHVSHAGRSRSSHERLRTSTSRYYPHLTSCT